MRNKIVLLSVLASLLVLSFQDCPAQGRRGQKPRETQISKAEQMRQAQEAEKAKKLAEELERKIKEEEERQKREAAKPTIEKRLATIVTRFKTKTNFVLGARSLKTLVNEELADANADDQEKILDTFKSMISQYKTLKFTTSKTDLKRKDAIEKAIVESLQAAKGKFKKATDNRAINNMLAEFTGEEQEEEKKPAEKPDEREEEVLDLPAIEAILDMPLAQIRKNKEQLEKAATGLAQFELKGTKLSVKTKFASAFEDLATTLGKIRFTSKEDELENKVKAAAQEAWKNAQNLPANKLAPIKRKIETSAKLRRMFVK